MPSGVRGRLRRFPTPNIHERIHAATASAIAAAGYEQTTIAGICAIAEVSPETFGEHFSGKPAAALSAVEAASDLLISDCHAVAAAAPNWPQGAWEALTVLTDWGACEPAFAQLTLVEIMKAGPEATELVLSLIDTFGLFLRGGYQLASARSLPDGTLDFTIGTEVLTLLRRHVLCESPETLPTIVPELAKAVLSPFLGIQEAERSIAEWVASERR